MCVFSNNFLRKSIKLHSFLFNENYQDLMDSTKSAILSHNKKLKLFYNCEYEVFLDDYGYRGLYYSTLLTCFSVFTDNYLISKSSYFVKEIVDELYNYFLNNKKYKKCNFTCYDKLNLLIEYLNINEENKEFINYLLWYHNNSYNHYKNYCKIENNPYLSKIEL